MVSLPKSQDSKVLEARLGQARQRTIPCVVVFAFFFLQTIKGAWGLHSCTKKVLNLVFQKETDLSFCVFQKDNDKALLCETRDRCSSLSRSRC